MDKQLSQYVLYADAVEVLQRQCVTLNAFSSKLKNDAQLLRLKGAARSELQEIYRLLVRRFRLPNIPVYFPVRKKIYVQGLTGHCIGVPKEIRIYPIRGCSTIPYNDWKPTDIAVMSKEEVFETFIHEAAHVLEMMRNGCSDHEKPFVEAYEDIETCLFESGYGGLINSSFRLTGVPRGSYADLVKPRSVKQTGCLTSFLLLGSAILGVWGFWLSSRIILSSLINK
jgi:hypothetical protein